MIVSRPNYVSKYGPTVGDKIMLADTGLIAEVEFDLINYGSESIFGYGKSLRYEYNNSKSGLVINPDMVITNIIIISEDAIYKADIGIKNGRIIGIGRSGNHHYQSDVDIHISASTDIISGEGLIITSGAIDCNFNFLSEKNIFSSLECGITTIIGGGAGYSSTSCIIASTPGSKNIADLILATDRIPVNVGILGNGSISDQAYIEKQIASGAMGINVHESRGINQEIIETALTCADIYDVQVSVHTDSENESQYVEGFISSLKGRVCHISDVEGVSGGHRPDSIKLSSFANILTSANSYSLAHSINSIDSLLTIIKDRYNLDLDAMDDASLAYSIIREETLIANCMLMDMGAVPIVASSSILTGNTNNIIKKSWQNASFMKQVAGPLTDDDGNNQNDNDRIKRYIAKYTINPSITYGISQFVGSIELGKIADLVLWEPAFFGVKPAMVIKGGAVVSGSNSHTNLYQSMNVPTYYSNCLSNTSSNSLLFTSKKAVESGIDNNDRLTKKIESVRNTRNISRLNMVNNSETPVIDVDIETYETYADGYKLASQKLAKLPLSQLYSLF